MSPKIAKRQQGEYIGFKPASAGNGETLEQCSMRMMIDDSGIRLQGSGREICNPGDDAWVHFTPDCIRQNPSGPLHGSSLAVRQNSDSAYELFILCFGGRWQPLISMYLAKAIPLQLGIFEKNDEKGRARLAKWYEKEYLPVE